MRLTKRTGFALVICLIIFILIGSPYQAYSAAPLSHSTQSISISTASTDPFSWLLFLGSGGDDAGNAVVAGPDGSIFVGGESTYYSWGTPRTPPAGQLDGFIARLDSAGELQAHTFLGGTEDDTVLALAWAPSAKLYAMGKSHAPWGSPLRAFSGQGDVFLACFSASLQLEWMTFLGASGLDEAYALALTPQGNLLVSGQSYISWGNPVMPFPGDSNYASFIASVSPEGELQWTTFPPSFTAASHHGSLAAGPAGEIYLAGSFDGNTGVVGLLSDGRAGGRYPLSNHASAEVLAIHPDGGLVVAGESSKNWGSPVNPHSDNPYNYSDTRDIFLARLNDTGGLVWNTFAGGVCPDVVYALEVDAEGGAVISGYSRCVWANGGDFSGGDSDAYLAVFDDQGNERWHTLLGGTGNDWTNDLAIDSQGFVTLVGYSGYSWGAPIEPAPGGGDTLIYHYFLPPSTETPRLVLDGPTHGRRYGEATFTAAFWPQTASEPITYTWEAFGQAAITHSGRVEDTVALIPSQAGEQVVAVTATSSLGTAAAQMTFTVSQPDQMTLSGLYKGTRGVGRFRLRNPQDFAVHIEAEFSDNTLSDWASLETVLEGGGSLDLALNSLADLPLGFDGQVELSSEAPIQAGLLAPLTPPVGVNWSLFANGAIRAVTADPEGEIYLGGRLSDQGFVTRLGANTTPVWTTTGLGYEIHALALAPDEAWLAVLGESAWLNADIVAARLTPSGQVDWQISLGAAGVDSLGAAAVDVSGDIILCGSSDASWGEPLVEFVSPSSIVIARLDSSGTLEWNTFLGQGNCNALALDSAGNIYLAGDAYASFGSPLRPFTSYDAYTARLDPDGGLVWNTFLGSDGGGEALRDVDSAQTLAITASGQVCLGGSSRSSWGAPVLPFMAGLGSNAFVACLRSQGELAWHTFLGAAGNTLDEVRALAPGPDGGLLAAGLAAAAWGQPVNPFVGSGDGFVALLGGQGELLGNTFLGGETEDRLIDMTAAGQAIYVTGISSPDWGAPISLCSSGDCGLLVSLNPASLDTVGKWVYLPVLRKP